MIAIDTNILLRYVLQDDAAQSKAVNRLMESGQFVLVTDVVLCEMLWTLAGKRYRLSSDSLSELVLSLLQEPRITFENKEVIWRTLQVWKSADPVRVGGKNKLPDFADVLILEKARYLCDLKAVDFDGMMTFDRAASVLQGASLLT